MSGKRLSVLGRLLILFLIILVPLFTAGAWGVYQANQKLEDQILLSMQQSTERFALVADNQLVEINRAVLTILAQGRVAKLERVNKTDADYETYYNINVMREFMSNVRSTYPIIFNIRVYLPFLEMAYNANGYAKGSLQPLSGDAFDALAEAKQSGGSLLLHDNRLISLQSLVSQYPRSIIEVEFNRARFSEFLASPLLYRGSYYYFDLPEQNFHMTNLPTDMEAAYVAERGGLDRDVSQIRFMEDPENPYAVFQSTMPNVAGTYVQFIPLKQLLQPSLLASKYVILLLAFLLAGILMFFGGAFHLIHKPLRMLKQAFESLGEDKNFGIRVSHAESPDFAYLYSAFNRMSEQLYQLICHDYSQSMLLQQANFRQLQAQINPHFLYNSFFMLHRMIKAGQHEESKTVARELGNYFQFISKRHSDTVPLSDEYTHARIYSNIQSVRFGDRIRVTFEDLPVGYEDLSVPKLILQPIVENAFNYGLENKVEDGRLLVHFERFDGGLHVFIEENGEELTDARIEVIRQSFSAPDIDSLTGEMGALQNIRKRLQIHYRREDVLTVSRSTLGGLCVQVSLFASPTDGGTDAIRATPPMEVM